jgi:mycothiol synthase
MDHSLRDLVYRHPGRLDAQAVLALMARCETADSGASDSDLDDLLFDWDQMDLNQDAWLVLSTAGEPVGYAAVIHWGQESLRLDFCVDPAWRGTGLEPALINRGDARAAELAVPNWTLRTYISASNIHDRAALEDVGFRPNRYHMQMRIDVQLPPAAPTWPAGVSVRTALPGKDDRTVYHLIQEAFDRPGRTPQPFEDWQRFMLRADLFRPDLWFLAMAGDELVGACLAYPYAEQGWVRQLGVSPAWRRQGLGRALLLHAFSEFHRRGFGQVGLAVAADNPQAVAFYQQIGMICLRRYDEYSRAVRTAPEALTLAE